MNVQPGAAEDESGESTSPCPECGAGVMSLEYITYFTWLNNELITVPNFPAWICDVCGRREFDPRAVTWLNTLLTPGAGRTAATGMRRKSRLADSDQPQP